MQLPNELPIPEKRERWTQVDSTKLQSYAKCPRKFFYEYVLGWKPSYPSNHLVFGGAWHLALERLYRQGFNLQAIQDGYRLFITEYRKHFGEEYDDSFKGKSPQAVTPALLRYIKDYSQDLYRYEVLATEQKFLAPIAEERLIICKIDTIMRRIVDDRHIVLEHKTGTSAGRTWEDQWRTSLQVGSYLHALNVNMDIEDAIVIVNGTFFLKNETKNLRVPCERSGEMMLQWLYQTNQLWDMIEEDFQRLSRLSKADSVMECFLPNPTACTDYSGCPYHDLCTSVANPIRFSSAPPSGFAYNWWNPEEVEAGEEVEIIFPNIQGGV